MTIAGIHIPTEHIEAFCQRWHLREFSLFGSVLRDDFGPASDVDVLITFEAGHEMTLEGFMAMTDELKLIFGRDVDLVEKRLIRNPFRRHDILTTKRVLYAA